MCRSQVQIPAVIKLFTHIYSGQLSISTKPFEIDKLVQASAGGSKSFHALVGLAICRLP